MIKRFLASCLTGLLFIPSLHAAEKVYTPNIPDGANPAAYAAPRDSWYKDVQGKFDRYGDKHADIVFDGDSITNRWEGTGKEMWESRYKAIGADFGIEGDQVQNLLWRLEKGQVDGVDPKIVVIMIGTNNTYFHSAEQIAGGIAKVVEEYKKRCPQAHIILMGVFPRGEKPDDQHRIKMAAVNKLIEPLGKDERVSFVDISSKLMEPDGTISKDMMPDFVHPTAKGYVIWAEAIQPIIDQYLKK